MVMVRYGDENVDAEHSETVWSQSQYFDSLVFFTCSLNSTSRIQVSIQTSFSSKKIGPNRGSNSGPLAP